MDPEPVEQPGHGDETTLPVGGEQMPGDRIGPYRLLEQIGEGGFGVVWLAERREPMVQRVALKVIKPGMDSKGVIARFEQERQALAVMDHPNVAKVLDGGVTPSGRPYFVMEHVKGEPITSYADRQRLTIKQRLELFVPVCEAVQHAHMKGIIHRDLKPGNILVAAGESGSTPVVKVIDFGVAKAISQTLTEKTIFTERGQLIGTPEYMSPEQAEMGATDIDTRSDVYSLGVVLYELLSGTLPFDSKTLRSAGYAEIQRIIREVEAPAPSTRFTAIIREDSARADSIAAARRDTVRPFARIIRAELEWIPLKALRKDRTERYALVADLAADVERYIRGEVLVAGPITWKYRLGKWIARRELATAWTFVVVSVLLYPFAEFPIGVTPEEWSRFWVEMPVSAIPGVMLMLLSIVLTITGLFGLWARLLLKDQCSALARVLVGGTWFLGLCVIVVPLRYAVDHIQLRESLESHPLLSLAGLRAAFGLLLITLLLASPLLVARAIGTGWLRTYAVMMLTLVSAFLVDEATIAYRDFWLAQRAQALRAEQLEMEWREDAKSIIDLPPADPDRWVP